MENRQENKMGTMNVRKLLISMSLPMMVSMLVQALYNIVDSIFVAQYDEKALTAVTLTFPVQTLMIAVASGTGVGVNSLLSRQLGEKRFDGANNTAVNGLFLALVSSVVFAIITILLTNSFFQNFTSDAQTIIYGREYMSVCMLFSTGVFMQIMGERLLQSTGKTMYNMITQTAGAIINIILDPIMIFGMFGFPEMGVAGAAYATVIGQWVAMFMALYYNLRHNREIQFSFKKFRPDAKTIADIYRVGVPAIIMQSIMCVMTIGMNKILADDTAISVFGVYYKIQSFIFMPIFGMTNALIPIIAYNYGARRKDRMLGVMKVAMVMSLSIMGVGTILFEAFPEIFLAMFKASDKMLELGIPALRIFGSSFLISGVCIILIAMFQGVGEAVPSMIVSGARQLVVLLPVAFVLKKLFGFPAVWWSLPLAELSALIMCIIFCGKIYKKRIKNISE